MITRFLKFMAPADDAGGETAVLEPPVTDAPMTPVADVYKAALLKAQGGESDATTAKPDEKKAAPVKPAKEAVKEEAKVEIKPATALDAALGGTPAEKKEDAPESDPLKDLPEMLPREGRGEHWAKARGVITGQGARIGELTKTNAELLKQVEAAKSTPPELAKENAALKEKLDSYRDAIVAVNLNLDPEHRAKFVDGRVALVNRAAAKLAAFGGNGDRLKAALGMPESRARTQEIKESLGELEEVERTRVLQFVSDVEKLDDEKSEIEKDPQQAWEKLERSRTAARQKEAQQIDAYKKDVFDKTFKELPKTLPLIRPADAALEGATEHNERIQKIRDGAWRLLGNDVTPEMATEAAVRAELQREEHVLWMADREELKKARAALREYEESEPGFRGGKPPKKSDAEEKMAMTPGEIYKKMMAGDSEN